MWIEDADDVTIRHLFATAVTSATRRLVASVKLSKSGLGSGLQFRLSLVRLYPGAPGRVVREWSPICKPKIQIQSGGATHLTRDKKSERKNPAVRARRGVQAVKLFTITLLARICSATRRSPHGGKTTAASPMAIR